MDRAEKVGLGIAVAGHLVLFGLLSVGFLSTPNPEKLKQTPLEVSLVTDVALEAAAPQPVAPPAQSAAPDTGEPEDAAPPEESAAEPEPEPRPAPPAPQPAPPKPAPPKPEPPKPAPPKPAPPRPAPAPKPAPVKPRPKPKPAEAPDKPAAKSAPAKRPAPAKPAGAKPAGAKPAKPASAAPAKAAGKPATTAAKPTAAKGTGTKPGATAAKPRGSRLGSNFLEGLTSEPSTSTKPAAPAAAKIDGRAMASIVQAIARQIQPCANRQVNPGPGANQIVTTLNLRLNADGTLAATPRMVRQSGVDDENERYKQRVVDLGVAAFKGCSPLKLPADYYSTPSGGWNNINFQWKLQ